jgi:hypothetical protein
MLGEQSAAERTDPSGIASPGPAAADPAQDDRTTAIAAPAKSPARDSRR